jgi:glucose-6-phosphate dehydrogenase assembly protein OpcA
MTPQEGAAHIADAGGNPEHEAFLRLGGGERRSFDSARIERELRALWKSPPGTDVFYRAALANLVVPLEADSRDRFSGVIAEIARRHPARIFRIEPEREAGPDPARLSARATALCHIRPGGGAGFVCSEMIVLEWSDTTGALLSSAVECLLIADLPLVLLRLDRIPETAWGSALMQRADIVIVDSAAEEEPAALPSIWDRVGRHGERVRDLAWARLEPWRAVIAEIFDRPVAMAALREIRDVTIAHGGAAPPSGAWLLAGWLASRLGWRLESRDGHRWRFRGAHGHVDVALERDRSVAEASILSVHLRAAGQGKLDARIEPVREAESLDLAVIEQLAPESSTIEVPFPRRDLASSIIGEMQRRVPNPTFRSAAAIAHAMIEA